jgi:inner membrane protein
MDNRVMDNVCHTLVGVVFGESGLKRRTRFGNTALIIAANLPDVDVLAFASSTPAVAIRRGWTHGVLAQIFLPIFLTSLLIGVNRLWPSRRVDATAARTRALLFLSYVGVCSHIFLDYLNNYGVRLLMPFSERWYYGDALFIVDPWLWLVLGASLVMARRRRSLATARMALVLVAVYVEVMLASAFASRQAVLKAWTDERGIVPRALMVGPTFGNPLRKVIIAETEHAYQTGTFTWWPRRIQFETRLIPKNDQNAAVVRARGDERFRAILRWARFPYYELEHVNGDTRVTLRDLRFGNRVGAVSVLVPASRARASHEGPVPKSTTPVLPPLMTTPTRSSALGS